MKKTFSVILALVAALSLAACAAGGSGSGSGSGESKLTGTSAEVMSAINDGADYAETPMLGDEALSADNCENLLGLGADVFSANVEDGTVSYAMISSVAHMTAVIKCKDSTAAAAVKQAVADGFNMQRWVCVTPETAFVAADGAYVYFVASFTDYADALWTSFTALAGNDAIERTDITA